MRLQVVLATLALLHPMVAWSQGECARPKSTTDDITWRLCEYEKRSWVFHFIDGLQLTAEGSYTNSDHLLTGPGNATNVPREFDSEKGVGNVNFGMVDRKLIRDAWMIFVGGESGRRAYLEKTSERGNLARWLLFDAITAKMVVGYGTTLNDAEGTQNSKTNSEFLYAFGAKFTLPLDGGTWKNPLDKK